MSTVSEYSAKYTSYSGADIVATFAGNIIGSLQAVSYSVTREKTPIYSMGSPDPRSFSRGKRGVAGSLVFTVFDRDALHTLKKGDLGKIWSAKANVEAQSLMMNNDAPGGVQMLSPDDWETAMGTLQGGSFTQTTESMYADQILPFDIVISLKNEYGNSAHFSILGCEIINEGSGMSIDDISTEKACTFVARGLTHLKPHAYGASN